MNQLVEAFSFSLVHQMKHFSLFWCAFYVSTCGTARCFMTWNVKFFPSWKIVFLQKFISVISRSVECGKANVWRCYMGRTSSNWMWHLFLVSVEYFTHFFAIAWMVFSRLLLNVDMWINFKVSLAMNFIFHVAEWEREKEIYVQFYKLEHIKTFHQFPSWSMLKCVCVFVCMCVSIRFTHLTSNLLPISNHIECVESKFWTYKIIYFEHEC
jgi:hypothetical protein